MPRQFLLSSAPECVILNSMVTPRFWLFEWMRAYPFGVLLAALFFIIIGAPLTEQLNETMPHFHGESAIAPMVLLLTLAAAFAIWPTARSRATSIILGGIVVGFLYLSTAYRHDALMAVHLIAQTIFLTYVVLIMTRTVFSAPVMDGNVLCGAASLYLLIGVLMGFLYALIELFHPGSFIIAPGEGLPANGHVHPSAPWLIYFSFTTLTTVGFGDVLPSSPISRSMAVFEAVIGQMLLVVMMARLVGLHVAQVTSRSGGEHVVFEVSDKLPARSHHPK